ncbi:MAG: hypothetical protein Q9M11_05475 [Mariprofundaceae bacterium]|nr:hypothetical protein [Mariprofundaceae bacterium]
MNIAIFCFGILLLLSNYIGMGVMVITSISILELYKLFNSQTIFQAYNNAVMEKIYQNIH